jgi:creatinine amidohydrolase/Fe(II)-dependent formamide hydrolase-like protein
VRPSGVLGDPAGASGAEGEAMLARLLAELAAFVAAWPAPGADGGPAAVPGARLDA